MELTRTEFELLVALALRPGQVLTRHDLVTEVWDTTRGRGFIDTVRGVGYRVGQP